MSEFNLHTPPTADELKEIILAALDHGKVTISKHFRERSIERNFDISDAFWIAGTSSPTHISKGNSPGEWKCLLSGSDCDSVVLKLCVLIKYDDPPHIVFVTGEG